MTRQEIEQKIAAYQQAAQNHFEQWQRAIGAMSALVDVLNSLPEEVPEVPKKE